MLAAAAIAANAAAASGRNSIRSKACERANESTSRRPSAVAIWRQVRRFALAARFLSAARFLELIGGVLWRVASGEARRCRRQTTRADVAAAAAEHRVPKRHFAAAAAVVFAAASRRGV